MDIFKKRLENFGPLGKYADFAHGYYMFPKLEGPIQARMKFQGKEVLCWSLNNYLGLANHPEVRKVDAEAAAEWGLAYPMGARMMSGHSKYHEQLQNELAEFVFKEDAYLFNFGYQGMVSTIDALLDRHDALIYDSDSHACMIDGARLHLGKRYKFAHNDMADCEKQLKLATEHVAKTGGGILLMTEGVFGMVGDQGDLKGIAELKKKYKFRFLVDDAHGVGTIGETGAGAGQFQGVQDDIDLYFGTFAKSFALIGGFVAGDKDIIRYLTYNLRSQIYAKSLPMPIVIGLLKRLDLMRKHPEYREKLWENVNTLQLGLKEKGFNLGVTNTPVTPVMLNGTVDEATQLTYDLRENHGIFCSIVTHPVVPQGIILLRIIPTAVHSLEDVQYTIDAFASCRDKLVSGEYAKMGFREMTVN
ncbi:MAG: aminotransferase class I/II-fold pyridoxal phosphate-dependent enzyme [Bacteroidales bacterium]|nr:aminotransferase class I/II-fold pyridoxal phosphate-dependent enzyme [Bacteroidales bacterium]